MLSYPAAIPLSTRSLDHVAGLLRRHQRKVGTRWRRLDPAQQALLVLAQMRNGDTYTRLAAGFNIGVATAWRYVQEAIALLTADAPGLATTIEHLRRLPYVILDGTLIPIDRVADAKPYNWR